MTLSFLNTAGSSGGSGLASNMGSLASNIMEIYSAIKGSKSNAMYNALNPRATAGETRANALYAALSEPNSPLVGRMTEENLRSGVEALLKNITAMQLSDKRSMARGKRGTYFNPERMDETVSNLINRGLPALQQQARENAINDIVQSASGFRGLVPDQITRRNQINDAMAASEAYASTAPQRLAATGQSLQGLIDLFSKIKVGSEQQRPNGNFVGAMPQNNFATLFNRYA